MILPQNWRSVKRSEKVLELEAQPMPQEERADACLVTSNVNRAPFDRRCWVFHDAQFIGRVAAVGILERHVLNQMGEPQDTFL